MRHSFLARRTDTTFSDTLYGDSRSEYFELTWGDDRAYGGDGHDVFWDVDGSSVAGTHIWLSSNDSISAGAGDDLIYAGLGADRIAGGTGRDTLDYRYSAASVILDLSAGTGSGSARSAAAGDSFSGIELFHGSSHGDHFILSRFTPQDLTVDGGAGNDRFDGGSYGSALFGGAGNDTFVSSGLGTTAHGGAGNDVFAEADGMGRYYGGDGFDTLFVATGSGGTRLTYDTHDGIERFVGSAGGDVIDSSTASTTRSTVEGGAGNDTLDGGAGEDWLYGGDGNDLLAGAGGNDDLFGGEGWNRMDGGSGDDWMRGGAGIDEMSGGTGRDTMWGEGGNDWMSTGSEGLMMAGAGDDTVIMGGAGVTAFGNDGADVFVFGGGAAQQGRIGDFTQGQDRLGVDAVVGRFFTRDMLVASGPQAFDVLVDGTAAGRIDWVHKLGDTLVRIDRDLDGDTDYSLLLTGTFSLTAADVIL